MSLFRIISEAAMISATALSGPNLPAQGLAALREALSLIARRIGPGPA